MDSSIDNKTLEEIENDYWGEPEYDSYVVTTIHRLRKKKIGHFEIEDLRIMIGQNRGLPVLVPIAIVELKKNILAEGDYYEGDLLKSVLTSDRDFWITHPEFKKQVISLFEGNIPLLHDAEVSDRTRNDIFEAFSIFRK